MAVATRNSSVKPVRYLPAQHKVTVDMVQTATLNGKNLDANLINAVTQLEVVWSMAVASALSLTAADPRYDLWSSDLLNGALDLQLANGGGRWVIDRAHGIGSIATSGNQTVLQFWDYPTALLKQPAASIRKPSSSMDLAAWCRLLVREVKDQQVFVVVVPRPGFIPEVTEQDPTRAGSVSKAGKSMPSGSTDPDPAWMTDSKAGKLTPVQVAQVALKAGFVGEDAATAVAIAYYESTWDASQHFVGPVDDSWGLWQINVLPAANPQYHDLAYSGGLSKPLVNAEIAFKVWVAAGRNFWQPWLADQTKYQGKLPEARLAVQAALSGNPDIEKVTGADGGGATLTKQVIKPAEWKRSGNTWHALGQLGNRIGRRRFVALPRNPTPRLVFARDQDLINALPHMIVGINDGLLTQPVDISLDGHSRIQTVDLSVFADAWIAPPGAVVELDESFGAAAGMWLVLDVTSTTGDESCQVTLTKPTTQPHPVTVEDKIPGLPGVADSSSLSSSSSANASKIPTVVAAAQSLSNMHLPYSGFPRVLTHQIAKSGYDCSSGMSWCLLNGGFPLPGDATWGSAAPDSTAFESWGIAGPGKYMTVYSNADHCFIRFTLPGLGTVGFDSGHSGAVAFQDPWYQDPFRDAGYVASGENGVPFVARHWAYT